MSKKIFLGATGLALLIAPCLGAQPITQVRDQGIVEMINQVSRESIETHIQKLVSFHTRHSLSDTASDKRGIGAARRWILAQFESYAKESGGRLKPELDGYWVEADGRRISSRVQMKNVLAVLPGTDTAAKRVLIVSGHYDSRASGANDATSFAPGANDDASGTAVVIELARIMSKREFPATIIFAAVAGEEQGLYGAKALANRAKNENWYVVAMITNDIVGNSGSSGTHILDNVRLRVFSEGVPASESERRARIRRGIGGENDSSARQFARYIKEVGERYVDQTDIVLIYRRDRFLRGGDHTPFSALGYTAVRLTEMNENYDHQHQNVREENGVQYGDLPKFVDFGYVGKVAKVNLSALANLALAPGQPDSVGIVVSRLTNETTLRWQAPIGKSAAGYFVLMRQTTSPVWQRKIYVGNVSEATLPYSKDNYIFALQSVDSEGHESLPVFPFPLRRRSN